MSSTTSGKDWNFQPGMFSWQNLAAVQIPTNSLLVRYGTSSTCISHGSSHFIEEQEIWGCTQRREAYRSEMEKLHPPLENSAENSSPNWVHHAGALYWPQWKSGVGGALRLLYRSKPLERSHIIVEPQVRSHQMILRTHFSYFCSAGKSLAFVWTAKPIISPVERSKLALTAFFRINWIPTENQLNKTRVKNAAGTAIPSNAWAFLDADCQVTVINTARRNNYFNQKPNRDIPMLEQAKRRCKWAGPYQGTWKV